MTLLDTPTISHCVKIHIRVLSARISEKYLGDLHGHDKLLKKTTIISSDVDDGGGGIMNANIVSQCYFMKPSEIPST